VLPVLTVFYCFLLCSRVGEHMLLIDAVKDLLNHVCSADEKTTVTDAVEYFTSVIRQTQDKAVIATSDTCSADDTTAVNNVTEKTESIKTQTVNTCAGDRNTCVEDSLSETSCRDEAKDVEVTSADVEVTAAAADRSVNDAGVKTECSWKLLIKVHGRRTKDTSYRYWYCHMSHAALTASKAAHFCHISPSSSCSFIKTMTNCIVTIGKNG